MAGKAVVLLEASNFWPECQFFGVEMDEEQLVKASENAAALPHRRCELLRGDVQCLPLTSGSVDVVLSDLPYGRQYGDSKSIPSLYQSLVPQVYRVLRDGGRAVLLTSEDFKEALVAAAQSRGMLQLVAALPFRFGGNRDHQRCTLCCFIKSSKEVQPEAAMNYFDWTLRLVLAEDPEFTWKDIKPSLSLYVPRRSTIAPCDISHKEKVRCMDNEDGQNHALATSEKLTRDYLRRICPFFIT
eukprot:gnl/MRDRNA2_/MRDRNA2_18914_c0_seq1.p1 gnl/MRDRNA2_/MRDRNA2_18914_c0~~gnl/MRDRNA2_/MRDRNA2_18914_c0_seq1.p1  ORF type:complete len:276 (+),score=29.19 gnl/MRDRNA2_/MRDRNA2_18914_c0_seq1:104-829(+)